MFKIIREHTATFQEALDSLALAVLPRFHGLLERLPGSHCIATFPWIIGASPWLPLHCHVSMDYWSVSLAPTALPCFQEALESHRHHLVYCVNIIIVGILSIFHLYEFGIFDCRFCYLEMSMSACVFSCVGKLSHQTQCNSPHVAQSTPVACNRAYCQWSKFSHDLFSVCIVTPNTCIAIPKNHKYIMHWDVFLS